MRKCYFYPALYLLKDVLLRLGVTGSGRKLRGWLMAAAIAWAAHHTGLTFTMEGHMVASITFTVQGEARGTVGPSREALIHAYGCGSRLNVQLAESIVRGGSLPLPHTELGGLLDKSAFRVYL